MTSNKNIPFAKSLIDYIFCWMGCQFIPGYAEKNTPNRTKPGDTANKNTTTAREVVEKTKDLAKKIDEAKALQNKAKSKGEDPQKPAAAQPRSDRFHEETVDRITAIVHSVVGGNGGTVQKTALMQQFNDQFQHFQDDAPACDVCGSICVRNGTCYRCYNCGNSMGCS